MAYALVRDDGILVRLDETTVPPPALASEKGLRWLPVTDIRPEPRPGETLDGPTIAVIGDVVTRAWTARPLTHDERLAACHADRRAAYPSLGDQMDAAFKARAGDPGPQTAIDAAIAAVKAAYPKPTS